MSDFLTKSDICHLRFEMLNHQVLKPLRLITVFPSVLASLTQVTGVWFAGTGVLILVGVALDTVSATGTLRIRIVQAPSV